MFLWIAKEKLRYISKFPVGWVFLCLNKSKGLNQFLRSSQNNPDSTVEISLWNICYMAWVRAHFIGGSKTHRHDMLHKELFPVLLSRSRDQVVVHFYDTPRRDLDVITDYELDDFNVVNLFRSETWHKRSIQGFHVYSAAHVLNCNEINILFIYSVIFTTLNNNHRCAHVSIGIIFFNIIIDFYFLCSSSSSSLTKASVA